MKFDLSLGLIERPDGISATFEFDTGLFERSEIEALAARFVVLLEALAEQPDAPLDTVDWLPAEEAEWLRIQSTGTVLPGCINDCLHDLVIRQARHSPDRQAVLAHDGAMTYDALLDTALRCAKLLREHRIGPDEIVAVALERQCALPAVLLGINLAGAAFLPLDPAGPPLRIAATLNDLGVRFAFIELGGSPGEHRPDLVLKIAHQMHDALRLRYLES